MPVLLASGAGFTKDVFTGLLVVLIGSMTLPSSSTGLPSLFTFVLGLPLASNG